MSIESKSNIIENQGNKTCKGCGHNLPITFFNENQDVCYYCQGPKCQLKVCAHPFDDNCNGCFYWK